jgi:dTDP-glucose 4,6-dehydratase
MPLAGVRVLVTGAGGFIGSHLAERLVRDGARVRAFVRYKSDGTHGWLDRSPHKSDLEVVAGDVTDAVSIQQAVAGCDIIFHLAALIGIPYSYQAPLSYVRTNVEGTFNILQAARDAHVQCVVHTSTSEVYGTAQYVPIDEHHPLVGQSPYAATKIGADKLAEAYHRTFGLPVVILRPFNTFGPRQSMRAVLPTLLVQLLSGRPVIRLGALHPRRDLTFVGDTVAGYLKAAQSEAAIGRTVQLGTGRDISIGELAAVAMEILGLRAEILSDEERQRPATGEVERLLSNPALAAQLIGWQPEVPLEQGIRLTADWLQAHLAHYSIDRYAV